MATNVQIGKIPGLTYSEIEMKIKLLLAQAFESKKIKSEELLAILYLLGQTTNVDELESFIEIFSDSFPVLKNFVLGEKHGKKTAIEAKVKAVVSQMVLENPLRAAALAKEALAKNVNWEELVKKYPELE